MTTLSPKQKREKRLAYLREYARQRRLLLGGTAFDRKQYESRKKRSLSDINVGLKLMLHSARTRSKKINREFDIDLDYIKRLWARQKGICKLSQLPMSFGIGTKNKVSIDRITSKKGYVKGNCQLIISKVNLAKNDMSNHEFIQMCKQVAQHNK